MNRITLSYVVKDFRKYAARYNCTIIESICDRDYPLNADELRLVLTTLDVCPTDDVMKRCRPDTEEQIDNYLWFYQD